MSCLAWYVRVCAYLATILGFCVVIGRAELTDYDQYNHELIKHFGLYKYRFITTWNFILLSAHALLALCCEFLVTEGTATKVNHRSAILKVRDVLFTGVVFPVSLLVASVFWGLYAVNRELIFPTFLEAVLPPFDNHAIHTAIVPAVLMEVLLQPRPAPRSHAWNYLWLTVFFIFYGIPFFGTYFVHGKYLYPFIELLSPVTFVVFCGVLWGYAAALYRLQWPLAEWLGPRSAVSPEKIR